MENLEGRAHTSQMGGVPQGHCESSHSQVRGTLGPAENPRGCSCVQMKPGPAGHTAPLTRLPAFLGSHLPHPSTQPHTCSQLPKFVPLQPGARLAAPHPAAGAALLCKPPHQCCPEQAHADL